MLPLFVRHDLAWMSAHPARQGAKKRKRSGPTRARDLDGKVWLAKKRRRTGPTRADNMVTLAKQQVLRRTQLNSSLSGKLAPCMTIKKIGAQMAIRFFKMKLQQRPQLNVKLTQRDADALDALVANMKRNTVPLAPSSVRCARYLGCLRCFPASYYSPAVLTKRGWHECASVLRHHPICAETVGTQDSRGLWVTPRMGEWIQGLPRGWAATAPLEEPVEPMVRTGGWQHAISNRMSCVDLFTGCGAGTRVAANSGNHFLRGVQHGLQSRLGRAHEQQRP